MSGVYADVQGDDRNLSDDAPAAPVVGALEVLFGAVTITRPGAAPAKASIGDSVCEGDALDTGDDGVVVVAFHDGTTLHLHANGHLVLDGISSGSDERAVVRIAKGVFGVVWGNLTAAKPLDIETPVGRLRTKKSAVGLGSIALGVFTFALIRDLRADSADIAFIDNGTVDYKDLKHGVFEIVLEGQNGQPPRVIVVDDPTRTIVIRHTGSGYSVQAEANSPLQMAQYQNAYSHAYSTYSEGQQDPLIQQWQHANNAQPQSNPGGEGSSTSLALLSLSSSILENSNNDAGPTGGNIHGSGGSNTGSSGGTSGASANGLAPALPNVYWHGGVGSWDSTSGWSDATWTPVTAISQVGPQSITIDASGSVVTITNGGANFASALTVGDPLDSNSVLDLADGTLTVYGPAEDYGLIKANSTGADPILTFANTVMLGAHGEVEALGDNVSVYFQDATMPAPGIYSVDNFGTIAAVDTGATVFFEQAVTKNESGGEISSSNLGTIQFDQGNLDNSGTLDAGPSGIIVLNQTTVINEAVGSIVVEDAGGLTFDQGTLQNIGTVTVESGATLTFNNEVVENLIVSPSIVYGVITVNANGTLNFAGTVTIDNGTLTNAGTMNVGVSSSITADVTIENENGGTTAGETGATTASGNGPNIFMGTGSSILYVLDGSTLTLSNDTVSDGTITVDAGGTLILAGTYLSADVHLNIEPGGTLEVFDTTTIDTIQSVLLGQSTVESGTVLNYSNELILGGLTVDGPSGLLGAATVNLEGNDTIGGNTAYNGQTYQGALSNAGVINNVSGANTIEDYDGTVALPGGDTNVFVNTDRLEVFAGSSLTLTDDVVANSDVSSYGLIQIDASSGPTIAGILNLTGTDTIDNGQLINYGTMAVGNGATASVLIENENGSATTNIFSNSSAVTVDSGATLTLLTDQLSNTGSITVDHLATLSLTGIDTITGGGTLTNSGTISAAGTISIGNETLTNNATGSILVGTTGGAADTLTLSASTVTNAGSITVDANALLLLNGGDSIDNTVGGSITVDHLATLSLTGIDTITGGGTLTNSGTISAAGTISIGNETLTNNATGSILVGTTGGAADTLTLSASTVTNAGSITVDANALLLLNGGDSIDNTVGGSITVDHLATLSLTGIDTITGGGTLTNSGTISAAGTISIGNETLTNNATGSILVGTTGGAADTLTLSASTVTNAGSITVLAGSQLTLTGDTVSNTSGSIVVDSGGLLTAGSTTLTAGSVTNKGTLDLTGSDTIDSGSLDNAGTLTVSGTHNAITSETSFTNSDKIEVLAGGQLTLTGDTVSNTGGSIVVDSGGLLTAGSTTLTAGSVTNKGTLDLTGSDTIDSGGLDNAGTLTVSGTHNAITSETSFTNSDKIEVLAGGQLTLTGDTIDNTVGGSITVDHLATLSLTGIDTITGGGTLTNSGTISAAGTISIGNETLTNNATGSILVGTTGGAADTLTLSASTVTNAGSITVDANALLLLNGGDSIDNTVGGSITVDHLATLSLTGIDTITGGGTLTNSGTISAAGTISIGNETLTNNATGSILVGTTGGAADTLTLSASTVTNAGSITVDANALLLLNGGDSIDNTVGGSITVDHLATLSLTGIDTITGGGTLTNSGTISAAGTISIGNETLTNNATGSILVGTTGGAADTLTLSASTVTNAGSITVLAGSQLTLTGDTVSNTSGSIVVDSGGLLTAGSTTLTAGSVTNKGTLDLTGSDTIDSGSLDNAGTLTVSGTHNAITSETSFTNSDKIEVLAGGQLTLTGDTVSNTGGSIVVDSGGLLTAGSTTLTAGSVTNKGTLDLTGSDAIDSGSLDNAGTLTVSGTHNAITSETSFTNSDKIEVLAGGQLTLTGDTVSNTGGSIVVDSGGLLTAGSTTLTAGSVTNKGTLDLTGSDTIDSGGLDNAGTLTVSGTHNAITSETSFTNSDKIEVLAGGQLTLTGDTIDNTVGGSITVDHLATLSLTGIDTITGGGTLTNSGTISAAGTISIGNETLTNNATGSILVGTTGGAADTLTLSASTVTNAGSITVDANALLLLNGGDSIDNTVGGSITVDHLATLSLTGIDTITGGGTLTNSGTISAAGTISIGNETLTNNATGSILVGTTGGAADTLTLSASTVTNAGSITVLAGSQLTLTGDTVSNTSGSIVVDSGGLLTAGSTTLTAGSVTNKGTLDLTGSDTIDSGSLDNAGTLTVSGTHNAITSETSFTNSDKIEVLAGGQLTLTGDTVSNTGGSIVVDSGGLLTAGSTTLTAGSVTNKGTLDLTGSDTIDSGGLDNAGTLTVSGTHNAITSETSFTNSDKIEVLAGGQLTLTGDTIDNTVGGSITVDHLATLSLTGIDTITGGGTLTNSGTISAAGTISIGNETLTNNATGSILVGTTGGAADTLTLSASTVTNAGSITVDANALLLLNGGDSIDNTVGGSITVDHLATLSLTGIDTITGGGTLTNSGTIADNGNVTLSSEFVTNSGSITVSGGHTLNLAGGDTISGGNISNVGLVAATSGVNTISGATITNASTIEANGGTLTIDPSTVTNTGVLAATNGGVLVLSQTTVVNSAAGQVEIAPAATLTVANSTVTGAGAITIGGTAVLSGTDMFTGVDSGHRGSLTNSGTITDSAKTVSFTDENVTQNGGGSFTVGAPGETLSLTDVTFTGGSLTIAAGATLDLDNATISGVVLSDAGATINVSGSSTIAGVTQIISGAITVDTGQTLVVDHSLLIATVTNNGTGPNAGTVKVDNGTFSDFAGAGSINHGNLINIGTIDIADPNSPGDAIFSMIGVQVTNSGMLEVRAGGALMLTSDGVTNAGGTITVDAKTAALGSGQLTLSGSTINSGTLNNGGALTLTGTDTVDNGVFDNSAGGTLTVSGASNAITSETGFSNAGTITVETGGALTLTSDVVANIDGTITVNAKTATLGAGQLTLSGTTVNSGTLDNGGALTLTGSDTIDSGGLDNAGTLTVSGTHNAITSETSFTNSDKIEVLAGGQLTLTGDTIDNTVGGSITVDHLATLSLTGIDTITGGGTLTNSGTISAAGTISIGNETLTNNATGSILVGTTGGAADTLTLSASTVTNAGSITVLAGSQLTLTGDTVSNTSGSIVVDSGGLLTAGSTTLTAGSVTNKGTLDLTGSDTIDSGSLDNAGTLTVSGTHNAITSETSFTNSDKIEVLAGGQLTLTGDTVSNTGGSIVVDSGGLLTAGSTTLTAGSVTNKGTLDLTGSDTIDSGGLDNAGTLTVSGTHNAITSETSFTNSDKIEVLAGGQLTLTGDTIDNTVGGSITVDHLATLSLTGIDTITGGGTLTNSGTISAAGTISIGNETLTDTAAGALISVGTSDSLTLNGTDSITGGGLTNAGTINADGAVTLDDLTLTNTAAGAVLNIGTAGSLTLSGVTINGGTINDGTSASGATITVTGSSTIENASLNNGGITVAAGQTLTLDNDTVSGTTVAIDPVSTMAGVVSIGGTVTLQDGATIEGSGATGSIINNGVLEILGSATLASDALTNTGATLQVENGATLTLSGDTISGGSVTMLGSGTFDVTGSSTLDGNVALSGGNVVLASGQTVTLDDVTVSNTTVTEGGSTIDVDNDDSLTYAGTVSVAGGAVVVSNFGTIVHAGTISSSLSQITYDGDGTVIFDGGNRSTVDQTLINNGNTFTGYQTFGDATIEPTIDNASGTFDANVSGKAFDFKTTNLVTNAGTMEATDGGMLTFEHNVTNSGTIAAGPNNTSHNVGTLVDILGTVTNSGLVDVTGMLQLDGGTILGGTVNNGGTISTTPAGGAIDDATVDNGGGKIVAGGVVTLDGATINGGTLTGDSTASAYNVDGGDQLTLNGATVYGSSVTGLLENSGTVTINGLTIGGSSFTLDLTDAGTVSLGSSTISGLNTGEVLENDGNTIVSTGSSQIGNGNGNLTLDNAAGSIEVQSGTLTIDTGNPISNAGSITVASGATLQIDDGTVSNSGTIAVDGTLSLDGNVALDGGGTVSMAGGTLAPLVSGETLTNNSTIAGAGQIGTGSGGGIALNVVNVGLIEADISGKTLAIENFGSLTNSGELAATGGGTLQIHTGTIDNTGTIAVGANSVLQLDDPSAFGAAVTFNGAGTISLAGGTISGVSGVTETLNNANNTIIGYGNVGTGSSSGISLEVINAGMIEATGAAQTLTFKNHGPLVNTGTLEAVSGSTLEINVDGLTNSGSVIVDGTLSIDNPTTDGGTLTVTSVAGSSFGTITLSGGTIAGAVSGETLLNENNTISGHGLIGSATDSDLSLDNVSGTIKATGGTLTIDTGTNTLVNSSTLEAIVGTLVLDSNVNNVGGTIEATGVGAVVGLNNVTIAGGALRTGDLTDDNNGIIEVNQAGGTNTSVLDGSTNAVTVAGYVQIESGANLELKGTIDNTGIIEVDPVVPATANALEIGGTVTLTGGGAVTLDGSSDQIIAASGAATLDNYDVISGAGTIGHNGDGTLTLDNETGGSIEAVGGTLTIDTGAAVTNSGTIETGSGGTLQVDDSVVGTGSATIGSGGVMEFELGVSSGQTITFVDGTGTLKLADASAFDATLTGLQSGDIIDLTNETVTSAVWNGSTLAVNGTPVTFAISGGLPSSDTFAFKADGSGGTDLVVSPQVLTFSASPVSGTEGSAIPLSLSDTLAGGATLTSLVISGIPTGASLSDAAHDVLTVANGSVTINASELADGAFGSLTITPSNDTGFTLSLLATATGSNAYNYTVAATESVMVDPTAPTVTSAAVSGVEDQSIALNLAASIIATESAGDSNALNSVKLTFTVPTSDTYTFKSTDASLDDVFTAGSGQTLTLTATQIAAGALNDLSITTANASNVSLAIAATEQDAQTNVSAPASGAETVTVYPTAPTVTSAAVSGIEGQPTALNLASAIATTGSTGDSNTLNSVTLTFTVPTSDTYTFKSADASLNETFTAGSGQTLTLTATQIADGVLNDLSITTANASNVSLAIAATEQDGQTNVSAPATGTETVTVDPTAPTVSSASVSGTAGQPIALNLSSDVTLTEGSGDSNSIGSVTLSFAVPAGDTLTFESTNASLDDVFTAGAGQSLTLTAAQIQAGALSDLSLTATTTSSVLLGVSAKDIDADGNLGAANTGRIGVNVVAPAGAAGSPINLALVNPTAANGQPITVTVAGVPSDWQLNQGTNLGNGVWTVQTDDLSALMVITAAALAEALVLTVNESWTNTDGTAGTVTLSDNVEAYAPGSPIFAWSGDDTLTGAGGNDVFVFAQPIGNDTIYNFNVVNDHIDLSGFGLSSFNQLQADISQDAGGDAVITIAPGESITLHGVDASALTAANFVFDETPLVENAGTMTIGDGATMPLEGVVDNTGIIALASTGDQTELQLIGDGVTLEGGGQVTLAGDAVIVGTTSETMLTNVDNAISGAGQIGAGDGMLTLVNEAQGTINANMAGGELVLDTGNAINNAGVLEASNGGTLLIDDPVSGGSAVIAGGTLDFAAKAALDVMFDNGTGVPVYGDLVLGDAANFSGQISGFTGTQPDAAHSDVVDLSGFAFNATTFAEAVANGNLILTATDGSNVATLTFDNFDGTLDFASDNNGGTLVTDPPSTGTAHDPSVLTSATSTSTTDAVSGNLSFADAHSGDSFTVGATPDGADYQGSFTLDQPTANNDHVSVNFDFMTNEYGSNLAAGQVETQSYNVAVADAQNPAANVEQTVSVSVGGPGNDHFVFAPGIGADTVTNFNPQQDTIELDHFANVQTAQELQALITTDVHGDAVINLGHNDSVTLSGVTDTQLQHVIQAGHLLLH